MNNLIKITCIIELVVTLILVNTNEASAQTADAQTEEVIVVNSESNARAKGPNIGVELIKTGDTNEMTAEVTITRLVNGVEETEVKTISGTEDEVRNEIRSKIGRAHV